jgi:branched-chain amino acid transport system ATP-binding protein
MTMTATLQRSTLTVRGLDAGYGALQVLRDVDLDVAGGEVLVVLGHNGAGKTTLLKTILGVVERRSGSVTLDDPAARRGDHRSAVGLVPQWKGVFESLTVREHIELGLRSCGIRMRDPEGRARLDRCMDYLPELGSLAHRLAGELSGGQRQMVSIGRVLAAEPTVILLDEPSTGLAPIVADKVLGIARKLASSGKIVILAEQRVQDALAAGDRGLILKGGRVVADAPVGELLGDPDLLRHF